MNWKFWQRRNVIRTRMTVDELLALQEQYTMVIADCDFTGKTEVFGKPPYLITNCSFSSDATGCGIWVKEEDKP